MHRYVDINPSFLFLPSEQVYNPLEIAKDDRMISIGTAAHEIDMTGQISSELAGYHFYSGIGGRLDFIRGAAMSKDWRSLIALPSTDRTGLKSRIVHRLA